MADQIILARGSGSSSDGQFGNIYFVQQLRIHDRVYTSPSLFTEWPVLTCNINTKYITNPVTAYVN